MVEDNLYFRIRQLETALEDIRDSCAFNLESPGNEDDTLQSVVSTVTEVLHDKYEFNMSKYLGEDDMEG